MQLLDKELREMSKRKLSLPKPRVHRVLFADNSPFKPKRERVRVAYQRHSKHRAIDNAFA